MYMYIYHSPSSPYSRYSLELASLTLQYIYIYILYAVALYIYITSLICIYIYIYMVSTQSRCGGADATLPRRPGALFGVPRSRLRPPRPPGGGGIGFPLLGGVWAE